MGGSGGRLEFARDGRAEGGGVEPRTEDGAARAYNKAARDLFGDLAYQNLIEKPSNRRK